MLFEVIKRKWHTFWCTPRILMKKFENIFIFKFLPDDLALKIQYKNRFYKDLDLKNPQTFNEKLQWLKLFNRNPEYIKLVDKYEVKEIVRKIIGDDYIIPTLGVWNSFDEINFDELPKQFVLKTTHSGGNTGVVICKDKSVFDIKSANAKITSSLRTNTFLQGREWPYKYVLPRIIAEKYLEDSKCKDLRDYKFMCFNGQVKCLFVCTGRNSEVGGLCVTFFDRDWNIMDFERDHPHSKMPIAKPSSYESMIKLAEQLSKNIPFVRVDFYEVEGRPYFGELTFFPGSGMEKFQPEIWDYKLGSWLNIRNVQGDK